ncbi:unnamed protein product [Triticum turgidum subsp. durum]|uniref:Uncharacterized protein n=1 Tax=Triticum turgidum subsp. durum TaxID=4567 RepID=A0A9R0SZ11_TRITD|nr:unnamed protein product [Triticum turgidum subsp. durum]
MGARRRRRRKMERRGGYARGPHQAATAKREVRTETKDPRMEASGSEDFAGVKATARRDAQAREGRMAPLLAQVEHMLDGLDDMDGAEDVPFDELIGMQGLVFHLVENAITICITYKSDGFKRMKKTTADGAVVLGNPVAPPVNGDVYADISPENVVVQ